MGREVRRVSKDWEHPKDGNGYIPLLGYSFSKDLSEWKEENYWWQKGYRKVFNLPNEDFWGLKEDEYKDMLFEEWHGTKPQEKDYMPDWSKDERTHIQMYEDCSEGTPISPIMKTPEKLAKWLVDNNASAFANMTATYDQWLNTINRGYSVSAVYSPETGLKAGTSI